jgi:hypothetical protein
MNLKPLLFSITLSLAVIMTFGCNRSPKTNAGCIGCHAGIEHASASHGRCISCHGGDELAREKVSAHRGMLGPKNPSAPEYWEKSCGACHRHQMERTANNIMYTTRGMIRNIRLSWGEEAKEPLSARGQKVFDATGRPLHLSSVAELDTLGGELYRKFCSSCHIGADNGDTYASGHAAGCAACHFPYNDAGIYQGGDPTVSGKGPYSASHAMEPLPPTAVCAKCHNRSGRIALSYQGLYDGNNGLVPVADGEPGPVLLSGLRNAVHIAPDVHFAAGMECIDCHTSREVMGDGFSYRNLYQQTEVGCADCHGGETSPRSAVIERENDNAVRESRSYRMQMRPGMRMVLTAKGNKYSNVFIEGGVVKVLGKRSGKLFTSKVITGTPAHTVHGHTRLECHSCHSRTVVQCYGCHTTYDKGRTSTDHVKGEETPGAFSETEDYRMLYPFPLAVNQRGKISPVTPGCQTFVTVRDASGSTVMEDAVLSFKGRRQLRFAPFFSHNTGKRAIGCSECHANPFFLGFGQHVVQGKNITPTMICERSADKPLDGFLTLVDGRVSAHSAITRENSRPLNGAEVRRTLSVNLCLVCHDKANDPIYRRKLDYRAVEDRLHSRLLSGE